MFKKFNVRVPTFLTYSIVLLIFPSCKSETAKITDDSAARNAIIDSTITAFQKKLLSQQTDSVFSIYDFNGSISVEQNGEKIYEKFQGFEDFKTKKELDSSSVFAIGSVSKQFTAALILLLEEQGKLKTADRVSRFLPEFQTKPFGDITIHQVLSHTSGISDLGNGLQSKPGVEFNYSNKGFRLLGEIIEKASGKSYDDNANEMFTRLGLTGTFTPVSFEGKHLAGAYTGTANNFQMIDNMPERLSNPSISVAAGGILSTVSDLHRWNSALYSGKVLKPESLKKLMTRTTGMKHPILGRVGYGYGIMMREEAPVSYFHSGYVKGSPSLIIYYPETKTSVVILSNIADEAKGKNAFFVPHKEVKKSNDLIQQTAAEVRREMGVTVK